MEDIANARMWAEWNFGKADLGHQRRTRRLVESAAAIARHPEKSFPQVFNWNSLRGFYNLCNHERTTIKAIQGPHWEQTRQAMAQQPLALIAHDTTHLDYTGHPALEGTGPIGNGNGQGFLQHNSLAIVPDTRQVLGLAYQQWRVRQAAPENESTYQRRRRKRESEMWIEGIEATGPAPEGCCWVDVGDRGSDIYEAMVAARKQGHHFLFRAYQDRAVFLAADRQKPGHLLDYARALPSKGRDTVEITGRGGRAERKATVQLAGGPVWLPPPRGMPQRKEQPILPVWVVRVWEPKPPKGVERIEWILLCSLPSEALDELKARRDWYGCRWIGEEYHYVQKSGCSEEDRRFETADGMEACVAILALVAMRVLQMRCALRTQPEAPARQVATKEEIQTVRRCVGHKGRKFTVRDFVRGVASLGGFLGRKRDGDPGLKVLWRGYQRLQDMVFGYLVRTHPSHAGESFW